MLSLQANNLAQDLFRFHWGIAGGGCVASQAESEPRTVSFLHVHYAMGNKTALRTIEDDVSPLKIVWRYRLNCDYISVANGGMHASSRGSETYS
jgi:hypothetical protein